MKMGNEFKKLSTSTILSKDENIVLRALCMRWIGAYFAELIFCAY